ncbi:MAG: hypothetical protein II631_00800, partial [Treponema sp.]|nr:hypothetical protein [Treponema sp.]
LKPVGTLVEILDDTANFDLRHNSKSDAICKRKDEFGLIAKSYPVDPILIEWRGTIQSLYDKYDVGTIYESHLEVGAMVAPRVEAYGAWKYTHNPLLNVKGHGAAIGAKIHW